MEKLGLKINRDNLKAVVRNIESNLFELINHVICSICQEFLNKPVTTPCGHSFCSTCIKRVISTKDNTGCPLCKNPVKRYCLVTDKVKSTLSEIFQELPAAFQKDVQDLGTDLNDVVEDVIKTSKLAQLFNQEYEKDIKSNKQKVSFTKKSKKSTKNLECTKANDSEDLESFVPVLKRSKKVIEYPSAKKKKMDDLVSISQREVACDSSVCDSSELDKKLEKIEKLLPEEKINEWFNSVENNIYLSSQSSDHLDLPPAKSATEGKVFSKVKKRGNSSKGSSVTRKNYKKITNPLHSKENEKDTIATLDVYEFIPSQGDKIIGKITRKSRLGVKNISSFQTLQSFTKESVIRNELILNENKEDGEKENETEDLTDNVNCSGEFPADKNRDVPTASQKFDLLLSESKKNEKKEDLKAHVLYSASQASSTQFLDCSYHSPVNQEKVVPRKRRSGGDLKKRKKSVSCGEEKSFLNVYSNRTELSTDCLNTRTKNLDKERYSRSKRKQSLDDKEASIDKKESFSKIMDLKSEEALDLEKSVEDYLFKFKKGKNATERSKDGGKKETKTNISCHISKVPKTKLMEILEELVNDNTVYRNHPKNAAIRLNISEKAEDNSETDVKRVTTSHTLQVTGNKSMGCSSMSSAKDETLEPADNLKLNNLTQSTNLLGFCTQEELPREKIFKEMVKKLEEELPSSEDDLTCKPLTHKHSVQTCNEKMGEYFEESHTSKPQISKPRFSKNEFIDSNFISFNRLGKIKRNKSSFISFLRLGRLTPPVKRSRSSVVKLVFPIGLSSFARRRALQDRFPTPIKSSTSLFSAAKNNLTTLRNFENENCASRSFSSSRNVQVSTGIQTSQKTVSAAEIQTSKEMNPSVEIQTVKENICCAGIQTSQRQDSPHVAKIFKSAEIQTSQKLCESCQPQLPVSSKISCDIETQAHLPGSGFGYDEAKTSPKKNNSNLLENDESCSRTVRSSKDRHYSFEKEPTEILIPPILSNKDKMESLSLPRKHFSKHRKISSKERKNCSPNSSETSEKFCTRNEIQPCENSLIIDSEMAKEFENTWVRKTENTHDDLVETKNKKNNDDNRKCVKGTQALGNELVTKQSYNFGVSSPKNKMETSPAYLTQNLSGLVDEVLKKYESRQRIPLNVRKVSSDDQNEIIDLGTPTSERNSKPNSQEQFYQVLKNIDLDLKGRDKKKEKGHGVCISENPGNCVKGEKSEESDSDFFVEQTPPRPSNSRIADQDSQHFIGRRSSCIEQFEEKDEDGKKILNSEGTDLIGDSVSKYASERESFLMVSPPQKILTPEKYGNNMRTCFEKRGTSAFLESESSRSPFMGYTKKQSFTGIQKFENYSSSTAIKNYQNQLNASAENKLKKREGETKYAQQKTVVKVWMKPDDSAQAKMSSQSRKKFCVVASSVKNLDMVKRFVTKFKMEYSSKPTKNMTHLIVGLHENEEEGKILPLCTPKLLFAIANKKWVISESWAETCLKRNVILPEENFEALDPVGGQGCRNSRLSNQPLLKDCEVYLLGNFQTISKEEFAGLILDCGGTVVQTPEHFSFSPFKLRMIVADQDCLNMEEKQLQELHKKYSTIILSRDVIIMSIQSYKLANFIPHRLHSTSEEELIKMGYPARLVKFEEEDSNWSNSK